MSRALWIPNQSDSKQDGAHEWERPFLQLPVPTPPMRVEQAPKHEEEEEGSRVIIIDL